jgi:hypothetical protein
MRALTVVLLLLASSAWAGDFNDASQTPSTSVGTDKTMQLNSGTPKTATKVREQINGGSSQRQTENTGFGATLKKSK